MLEFYLNSFDVNNVEEDCDNPNFYDDCKVKLEIMKEQDWMNKNIPTNYIKCKTKKIKYD